MTEETLPAVTAAREALMKYRGSKIKTGSGEELSDALEDLLAVVDRLTAPPADWPIPRYAMLDIWMALYGSERSEEFEAFADEHGFAETWARLCAEVRGLTAPPSEDEIEAGLKAWFEHVPGANYNLTAEHVKERNRSRMKAAIVAASGRRHLPTEPDEREWGLISPDAHPGQYGRDDRAHLVSRNREHVERQHRRGHPSIMLAHRRAPGPWEVCDEQ